MTQRQPNHQVNNDNDNRKPESAWDRAPLLIKIGAVCHTILYVSFQLLIIGFILFGLYIVFRIVGNIN